MIKTTGIFYRCEARRNAKSKRSLKKHSLYIYPHKWDRRLATTRALPALVLALVTFPTKFRYLVPPRTKQKRLTLSLAAAAAARVM